MMVARRGEIGALPFPSPFTSSLSPAQPPQQHTHAFVIMAESINDQRPAEEDEEEEEEELDDSVRY